MSCSDTDRWKKEMPADDPLRRLRAEAASAAFQFGDRDWRAALSDSWQYQPM
jgi:hypothetical protein